MSIFTRKNNTETTTETTTESAVEKAPEFTLDSLYSMDQATFDLIAFSLSGKVAGRITSLTMSLAGAQLRAANRRSEDDDVPTIDDYNDDLAELDAMEANGAFLNSTGLETPEKKEDQLKKWLGVRKIMIDRGFVPTPLNENYKFIIDQTIKRNNPTDEMLDQLASVGELTKDELKKIYTSKAKRAVGDTIETAKAAMQMAISLEPDTSEAPETFDRIMKEAIESSKKSAIIRGNNVEESLANLVLLKAVQ